MNYYDYILASIPLVVFATHPLFSVAPVSEVVMLGLFMVLSLSIIGYALFVRPPRSPRAAVVEQPPIRPLVR